MKTLKSIKILSFYLISSMVLITCFFIVTAKAAVVVVRPATPSCVYYASYHYLKCYNPTYHSNKIYYPTKTYRTCSNQPPYDCFWVQCFSYPYYHCYKQPTNRVY